MIGPIDVRGTECALVQIWCVGGGCVQRRQKDVRQGAVSFTAQTAWLPVECVGCGTVRTLECYQFALGNGTQPDRPKWSCTNVHSCVRATVRGGGGGTYPYLPFDASCIEITCILGVYDATCLLYSYCVQIMRCFKAGRL